MVYDINSIQIISIRFYIKKYLPRTCKVMCLHMTYVITHMHSTVTSIA